MKIREIMTYPAIRINQEEPVSVAARLLARYNVGSLPVCTGEGKLCGVVTDRDLVTRCMASGILPEKTTVGEIMTRGVVTVRPDADTVTAARLMAERQIRRLPVVENGRLCGMVSLGDLAEQDASVVDATDALTRISSNVSDPEGHL